MIYFYFFISFENALREKVPNVTIPYWDNTLDAELPDPRRSIMWSPLFFGNGNGAVVTGPFRRFTTPYGPLRRDIGADRRLMSKTDLENVFSRRWMWEISNPSAEDRYNLELLHNHVHVWIGEQMSRIESSSYDPAFFSHHAFVDCLWEEFRQRQRQHGINPGRDYPRIVGDQGHQPLVSMGLGRLLVVDGINDIFTQRIYSCQRRPECVPGTNHCGSPYIRCNWSTRTCLPLIMSNRPNNPVAQGPAQQQVPWWARLMQRNGLFGWKKNKEFSWYSFSSVGQLGHWLKGNLGSKGRMWKWEVFSSVRLWRKVKLTNVFVKAVQWVNGKSLSCI